MCNNAEGELAFQHPHFLRNVSNEGQSGGAALIIPPPSHFYLCIIIQSKEYFMYWKVIIE